MRGAMPHQSADRRRRQIVLDVGLEDSRNLRTDVAVFLTTLRGFPGRIGSGRLKESNSNRRDPAKFRCKSLRICPILLS